MKLLNVDIEINIESEETFIYLFIFKFYSVKSIRNDITKCGKYLIYSCDAKFLKHFLYHIYLCYL